MDKKKIMFWSMNTQGHSKTLRNLRSSFIYSFTFVKCFILVRVVVDLGSITESLAWGRNTAWIESKSIERPYTVCNTFTHSFISRGNLQSPNHHLHIFFYLESWRKSSKEMAKGITDDQALRKRWDFNLFLKVIRESVKQTRLSKLFHRAHELSYTSGTICITDMPWFHIHDKQILNYRNRYEIQGISAFCVSNSSHISWLCYNSRVVCCCTSCVMGMFWTETPCAVMWWIWPEVVPFTMSLVCTSIL